MSIVHGYSVRENVRQFVPPCSYGSFTIWKTEPVKLRTTGVEFGANSPALGALPDPRKTGTGEPPLIVNVTVLLVVGAVTNRFTIDPTVSVNPEMEQLKVLGDVVLETPQIPGPPVDPAVPVVLPPPLIAAQLFVATQP